MSGIAVARAEEAHWGYNCEEGAPFEWGLLDEDFVDCLEGRKQSPIPLSTTGSTHKRLRSLRFEYGTTDLTVINDGHTVEAFLPAGSTAGTLRIGNHTYLLERFHWHTPSEHWIDGNAFPMEIHMVHLAQTPGDQNVVVGALIRQGRNNGELDNIWRDLPENRDDEVEVEDFVLARLLPGRRESYRYDGSLTTPPCDEDIRWVVLAEPVEMSMRQIDKFRDLFFGNARFPVGNARPPQTLNDREVTTDVRGNH